MDASAIPATIGGVGRYLTGLLGGLAALDCHPTVFSVSGDTARWLDTNPCLDVRDVAPGPRPLRLAWEQLALPARIRKTEPSVHHSPHYTLPRFASVAKVVTIHDLTFD